VRGTRPAHSVAPPQSDALVLCRCDLGYSGDDGGPCAACEAGEYKQAVGDAAYRNDVPMPAGVLRERRRPVRAVRAGLVH
jgi:hypothetical protein